jgi:hypothetical protein
MAILPDLTKLTHDQLLAHVAAMQAENARLKASDRKLTLRVSTKGAVSLYGMGQWPVTLYRSQWERVIASVDEISAFIETNASKLATKA